MKRNTRVMLASVVAIPLFLTGCASLSAEGPYWARRWNNGLTHTSSSTQTDADRLHSHRQVADQDARSLVDDIDMVMLRDRPSRLSRWHNR